MRDNKSLKVKACILATAFEIMHAVVVAPLSNCVVAEGRSRFVSFVVKTIVK